MDNYELFLQYKGLRTVIGILVAFSGLGLFLELFLLERLSTKYFNFGPISSRKAFSNFLPREVLIQKIGLLSDRKIILSRMVGERIYIKFISSINNLLKNKGILYTQRIVLMVDEDRKTVICEVRGMYSSIILPVLIVINLSLFDVRSITEISIYEKISGLSMSILFGVFLFYYLRGRKDISDRVEKELEKVGP